MPWDSPPTRDNFFGGDLAGIRSRLDYLQDLGVTGLYLTPIFRAGTNHRYDTHDYLQIDPALGGLEDFQGLVADLHKRGMRLLLDAVFNHCGDGFWAFEDVRQRGPDSPYADWFFVDTYPLTSDPPSYQTCGGAAYLPKLNTDHPEVRAYLLDVTRHWLKQGADGWRLDVPWKVSQEFWREFRRAALVANPEAYLVAEVWRDSEPWLHGDTVHGVMNYWLRNLILDYCVLDHMDAEDFDYELNALRHKHGASAPYHLNLLGSHDTPRMLTLCGEDSRRARIAIVFQMTFPGVPMIYYGDEVGMRGGDDPLCRGGMLWEQGRWNRQLHETYRRLIRLRREHPALTEGDFESLLVFNAVYAYCRSTGEDTVLVVLNPRDRRQNVHIPTGGWAGRTRAWHEALSGDLYHTRNGQIVLEDLPARSALVLTPVE